MDRDTNRVRARTAWLAAGFAASVVHVAAVDAAPGDASWADLFGRPGLSGVVEQLVVFDGELLASGSFAVADAVTAIATWDGSAWESLRFQDVLAPALLVYDGQLVAGGTDRIATWSGSSWTDLVTTNGPVNALVAFGQTLIAAGEFTQLGDGTAAAGVVSWDGIGWEPLGNGLFDSIFALAVWNDQLIAMGLSELHAWNGALWSSLGSVASPQALAVHDGALVLGGGFSRAPDGTRARGVARWDGTSWQALGARAIEVQALAVLDGTLVAGGTFDVPGSGTVEGAVMSWNGDSWEALAPAVRSDRAARIAALAQYGGHVHVGGAFQRASGRPSSNVARWDGSQWNALGEVGHGASSRINAATVFEGQLAVAGLFTDAGGVPATRVARWTGSAWQALGSGLNAEAHALTVFDRRLIAGGSFTAAGGVDAAHIAQWDGSSWNPLATGMDADVLSLAIYDGALVAAGAFTQAGGVPAAGIARWNGTAWSALGAGVSGGTVEALAVRGGDLFAGGTFTYAGGAVAYGAARWNGAVWSSMGTLPQSRVAALASFGSEIVAGGQLWIDDQAWNLARWNGSGWSGGISIVGTPRALAALGPELVVGGRFGAIDTTAARNVARWDGTTWRPLGTGTDGEVRALVEFGGRLFAGGEFNVAGNRASHNAGLWDPTTTSIELESFVATASRGVVELSWTLAPAAMSLLRGVLVQRAANTGGPFSVIGEHLDPAAHMLFVDRRIEARAAYWYRLELHARDGSRTLSAPLSVTLASRPETIGLDVEPNPVRSGAVSIRFSTPHVAANAPVLTVYDVAGRRVRRLRVPNAAAGEHFLRWNGRDEHGNRVGRGVYLVRLQTGDRALATKLVVTRD